MRLAAAVLAALALVACDAAADAQRAGQLRYEGRPLEEWWQLRRDPSDATSRAARTAMRMLGARAVPFLAAKAAGPDPGDVIGGGVVLEDLCPGALPAMREARARHPSPALEVAIRRVQADSARRVGSPACSPAGEPVRPDSARADSARADSTGQGRRR